MNTVFPILVVVLHFTATSWGATLVCPPCIIPGSEREQKQCPTTPICTKQKRSADADEACPHCIPFHRMHEFEKSGRCVGTEICQKKKRDTKMEQEQNKTSCPPCIPWEKREVYKLRCSAKPVCFNVKPNQDVKEKDGQTTKTYRPCPPCTPVILAKYYEKTCPNTPICIRRKRGASKTSSGRQQKHYNLCPPCIPIAITGSRKIYEERCSSIENIPICNRQRRSVNCPPCLPLGDIPFFQKYCPDSPICSKTKRSAKKTCPTCIPYAKRNLYQGCPVTTPPCPDRKKRSPNCPLCIPDNATAMLKVSCLSTPVCKNRKARQACPPCIPVGKIGMKKECQNTRICGEKRHIRGAK